MWTALKASILPVAIALVSHASDWPEWRGVGRQGVWNETGVVKHIPAGGLRVKWRVPVRGGYAGPAVADGRVILLDFEKLTGSRVTERTICIDESSGQVKWTRSWEADYRGLDYANGPRATATIDGSRVYVLGAKGAFRCLRVADGTEIWAADFVRDFGAEVPGWGMSSAPLIVGDKVIAVVGGKGNSKVVAFDKITGKVVWRALSSEDSEPGYSQPILIQHGRAQLIIWHAGALESLDPDTGALIWSHPFRITMNTPIMTPAWNPPNLLVSSFFDGARMLELGRDGTARLVWASEGGNEIKSDKLHVLMSQPIIEGGFVFGICSYGQLRCIRRTTGERIWETQSATRERARNSSAWLVRHEDRVFILNDRGELIIAKLTPSGYTEDSRTKVITPTSPPGSRRELGAVVWSHPAFANRHLIVRNDEEVIRISLDLKDYR